ncbi:MAG: cytochrome b [Methylococcaceae bacterium]
MTAHKTSDRYGSLSIGLHWVMLLLLIAVYACIELRVFFPKGSDLRIALKTWHFMLGLSVFILASIRLAVHLINPVDLIESAMPGWSTLLSKLMQITLYVFMIGMPLAGWLLLSAEGKPIPFFGLQLPALIGESKDLAELIKDIHATSGTIGYFLIGLHASAALFHHCVLKDNTLLRILPKRD